MDHCPDCGKELDLDDYEEIFVEHTETYELYVLCKCCGYLSLKR